MIHIAIGTKAQCIKMAPIMRLLAQKGIVYNFIDLGQHALITEHMRHEFELKEPDVRLAGGSNVASLRQGFNWMGRVVSRGFDSRRLRREVFCDASGVCLVHGDTVSTLLAVYLAKRAGIAVAHVEAGLRSFDIRDPFPEELVRIAVMRCADVLCAPSAWAFDNLRRMGLVKRAVLIPGNTSFEAVKYSMAKPAPAVLPAPGYAVCTVHRMETIFSRQRMQYIVEVIARIAAQRPVVFVQHQPTLRQLVRFGLQEKLASIPGVSFHSILSHTHFVHLIAGCEFLITDGGSIQEESYYLDKPCLVLRRHTERQEGLGENVMLSQLSPQAVDRFLREYSALRRTADVPVSEPSAGIVRCLQERGWW